jgi:hypothetical protein
MYQSLTYLYILEYIERNINQLNLSIDKLFQY